MSGEFHDRYVTGIEDALVERILADAAKRDIHVRVAQEWPDGGALELWSDGSFERWDRTPEELDIAIANLLGLNEFEREAFGHALERLVVRDLSGNHRDRPKRTRSMRDLMIVCFEIVRRDHPTSHELLSEIEDCLGPGR